MMKKRYRKKIGDIIEIRTKKGLSYAQYTHEKPFYGSLIRVFKEIFEKRPISFKDVVTGEVQFIKFFFLTQSINQEEVEKVGNEPVPEQAQAFPIFKTNAGRHKDGTYYWWLWDGEEEWQIGTELTEEQKHYPVRGLIDYTALVNRIEEGWTHDQESRW